MLIIKIVIIVKITLIINIDNDHDVFYVIYNSIGTDEWDVYALYECNRTRVNVVFAA